MTPAVQEARLYGILDLGYVAPEQAVSMARDMLVGGVHILQLRGKQHPEELIVSLGRQIASVCREHHVPLILNDYPHLVKETGADGVHVGQDDMSVDQARRLVGEKALVGKSTHSLEQVKKALSEKPDYIGFGPLFATPTKPDYTPIGVKEIAEAHRIAPALPIFCIGGIKRENLHDVLLQGARRVVIVSGILQAQDVAGYCQDCLELLRA